MIPVLVPTPDRTPVNGKAVMVLEVVENIILAILGAWDPVTAEAKQMAATVAVYFRDVGFGGATSGVSTESSGMVA